MEAKNFEGEFANLGNKGLVSRLDNRASSTKSLGNGSSTHRGICLPFFTNPKWKFNRKTNRPSILRRVLPDL